MFLDLPDSWFCGSLNPTAYAALPRASGENDYFGGVLRVEFRPDLRSDEIF